MTFIVQANIDRFKRLLLTEGDPSTRVMIVRLLSEQQEVLRVETTSAPTRDLNMR